MARTFTRASSEKITLGLGALGFAFGPGTMAAIVRLASTGVTQAIFSAGTAASPGGPDYVLYVNSTNVVGVQVGANARLGSSTLASGTWYLVAATKDTGTVTPRLHIYDFATGAFTHEAGSNTAANSGVPATEAKLGARYDSANFFDGDIDVVAVWNVVLTDAQVESLPFSLAPWFSPAQPKGLWLLDQAATGQTVPDLSGGAANQSAITGTAVSANSVPVWTPHGEVLYVTALTAAPPVTISAPAAAATAAFPAPVHPNVIPTAAAATASSVAPSVQLPGRAAVATATASAPAPTLKVTVIPPPAVATASFPAPSVAGELNISPPAAQATASAPAPAVVYPASVAAEIAVATAAGIAPSLKITVEPPVAAATASSVAPRLKVTTTPPSAAATAAGLAPSLTFHTTVHATIASATASMPAPRVFGQGLIPEPTDTLTLAPESSDLLVLTPESSDALVLTPL